MGGTAPDVKEIFAAAIGKATPQEQAAYLNAACGSDGSLRAEVESLVAAHRDAGPFLRGLLEEQGPTGASPLTESPGTVIGRYKLLEKIGEGGMAVVYLAEQEQPIRRRLALKIIKLGMDTRRVIARFEAERQALARMDHPNIARVFDAGATQTGRPYFVMELVLGVPITQYCDQHQLDTRGRLELFVRVCQAVHHAHQKGIIHRDLKPSNILVTVHDGRPVPKVIDFGIAKATSGRLADQTFLTRYSEMIGTPEYMSPEQAQAGGLDLDTRTDIYSLGVVLYELLTGALPYDSDTLRAAALAEVQRIIREVEPLRPSTRLTLMGQQAEDIAARRQTDVAALARRLHRELEWIPLKAMRKDRSRRYASASEFADDMQNYLDGRPLVAGPESAAYRLRKFVHRHRTPVAVSAAIAAALLIGLIVSTSLYLRVQRAQRQVARLEGRIESDRRLSTAQRLYAQGQYQAALTEVQTNLLKGNVEAGVRLLHAQLLCDVGRPADAERELPALLQERPEVAAAAHYLLARIYVAKDPDRAAEHQLLAESLLPHSAEAYTLRAMTADTPDDAIGWLSRALEQDPAHYGARKARALAYYGLRDYARMLQDVEVLLVMRPRDSLGYSLRALARRELGQLQPALADHTRALELGAAGPEQATLYDQRQETYWRMKNYPAALADAQRCVALEPENIVYRVALAKALFRVGRYEASIEEFDRLHKMGGKAVWLALASTIQYALDMAGAGEPVAIPDSIAQEWPFRHMLSHVRLHRQFEQIGTRLARNSLGFSSWSPDGTKLAYARCEYYGWDNQALRAGGPNISALPRGIEVLDTESGRIRVLVTNGVNPAWSPDGRYIAFCRTPAFLDEYQEEVWLMPAAGGPARRLARGGDPFWTNNPRHLYFQSRLDEALCRIDVDDPAAQPVRVAACPSWYPQVSPDERFLAYAAEGQMKVVELSSGKEVVRWVVPGYGEYCVVRWSPDGKEISLSSLGLFGLGPTSGLWVFDLEKKQGRHLFDPMALSCNWTKDRSCVAIDVMFPVCEIWATDMKPGSSTAETLGATESRAQYLRSHWGGYAEAIRNPQAPAWLAERVLAGLSAVGVNQHECGQYDDAAWTLREADKLWQARFAGPEARTLAFLALALQRLDRRVEAADELARLRARYEDGATCDESYLFRAERALAEGDEQLSAVWDLMSAGRFAEAWRSMEALRAPVTGDPARWAQTRRSLAQAVARGCYRRAKTIEHLDGPPAEILQNLLMSLSADPNYVPALRDLAWLRAVCPAGEYREGGQAVAHARKACELTGWQDERCLSVLAAASAEAGDFRSAVQRQTEAIRLAGQKTPATSTDEMEARLKLYEAGRHLHTDRVHPLVAWWKLDEGAGTVCSDSSGHGHTATVMGNLQWRAGRWGGALLFNDKDYVDCGHDRAFNLPHEITIACWMQTPGFTQEHQTLVAKGDSSWRLQRLDSTNRLAFHCDGLTTTSNYYAKDGVEGKTKVDDGQWHHVAAVYDGASLQLYLDGVLDNAEVATGTIAANEQPVCIGSNGAPEFPKEWNGLIDEVRIYNRALSAVEIADLHGREATNPSAGVLNR